MAKGLPAEASRGRPPGTSRDERKGRSGAAAMPSSARSAPGSGSPAWRGACRRPRSPRCSRSPASRSRNTRLARTGSARRAFSPSPLPSTRRSPFRRAGRVPCGGPHARGRRARRTARGTTKAGVLVETLVRSRGDWRTRPRRGGGGQHIGCRLGQTYRRGFGQAAKVGRRSPSPFAELDAV